jgi:hypothetical protein
MHATLQTTEGSNDSRNYKKIYLWYKSYFWVQYCKISQTERQTNANGIRKRNYVFVRFDVSTLTWCIQEMMDQKITKMIKWV